MVMAVRMHKIVVTAMAKLTTEVVDHGRNIGH